MPETPKGNRWILVLTDHFSRWQDAIPLPDATAPTVATALDERIFCYFGLPEELHTDQGAQFESRLMAELCQLWGVKKTRTTPYHPQGNGVVERGNRSLGDSLRALLLNRGPDEWDLLLPQIMRAYRGTLNSTTGETANLLMLGRETKLPDQLTQPVSTMTQFEQPYVQRQHKNLTTTHQVLRERQMQIRAADTEEPPLFVPGDLVLLSNKRRRKKENPKLQPKFVGPYVVITSHHNHTYEIDRDQQRSVQHEYRLKLFRPCETGEGQAPCTQEAIRRPNMKGAVQKKRQTTLRENGKNPENDPPTDPNILLWNQMLEKFESAQQQDRMNPARQVIQEQLNGPCPTPTTSLPSPINLHPRSADNANDDDIEDDTESSDGEHEQIEENQLQRVPNLEKCHPSSTSTSSTPPTLLLPTANKDMKASDDFEKENQQTTEPDLGVVLPNRLPRARNVPQRFGEYVVHQVRTGDSLDNSHQLCNIKNNTIEYPSLWEEYSRSSKVSNQSQLLQEIRFVSTEPLANQKAGHWQREKFGSANKENSGQAPTGSSLIDRASAMQQELGESHLNINNQLSTKQQIEGESDATLPELLQELLIRSEFVSSVPNHPPSFLPLLNMAQASLDLLQCNDNDNVADISWDSDTTESSDTHPSDKSRTTENSSARTALTQYLPSPCVTTSAHSSTSPPHDQPNDNSDSILLAAATMPVVVIKKISEPLTTTVQSSVKKRWITPETLAAMETALNIAELKCKDCDKVLKNKRGLKSHVGQHYWHFYCQCRFTSTAWDSVQKHQIKSPECLSKAYPIYRVDSDSYTEFCQHMNWKEPPNYPALRSKEPRKSAKRKKPAASSSQPLLEVIQKEDNSNVTSTQQPMLKDVQEEETTAKSTSLITEVHTGDDNSNTTKNATASDDKADHSPSRPAPPPAPTHTSPVKPPDNEEALQLYNDVDIEEIETPAVQVRQISPIHWSPVKLPAETTRPDEPNPPDIERLRQQALRSFKIPKLRRDPDQSPPMAPVTLPDTRHRGPIFRRLATTPPSTRHLEPGLRRLALAPTTTTSYGRHHTLSHRHRENVRCAHIQPQRLTRRERRRIHEVADEMTQKAVSAKKVWEDLLIQADRARETYDRYKKKAKDLYRRLDDDN